MKYDEEDSKIYTSDRHSKTFEEIKKIKSNILVSLLRLIKDYFYSSQDTKRRNKNIRLIRMNLNKQLKDSNAQSNSSIQSNMQELVKEIDKYLSDQYKFGSQARQSIEISLKKLDKSLQDELKEIKMNEKKKAIDEEVKKEVQEWLKTSSRINSPAEGQNIVGDYDSLENGWSKINGKIAIDNRAKNKQNGQGFTR